jgi:N-acetylglucosamine kinase-like BadF-type ATPase
VSKKYILGVDGGGTKTLAAIADLDGNVRAASRTGASNFQSWGTVRAGIELKKAINGVVKKARISPKNLVFATYGIAGADRDDDFDIVHSYLQPANPAAQYMITNDTTIALRAGTATGSGVALIGGTGSNTIGFSENLEQKKVGGLGSLSGDAGSAIDLAEKAVVAAMRDFDGRGPKTLLNKMLCERLGIAKIEDIIAFFYVDDFKPIEIGDYAPVLFEAANAGDKVALKILRSTGKEVGHGAVACIRSLFKKQDSFRVVLGGSVYQRGANPTMIDALSQIILSRYPNAEIVKLKAEPALGAMLWSMDNARGKPTSKKLTAKLASSLKKAVKGLCD